MPIIVDESFTRAEHWNCLTGAPEARIVNLRVSKMGGHVRSLEAAREAQARGVRIVVGSQVGETSLLTGAGLAVASAVGSALRAYEGAFLSHLLAEDPCAPAIPFEARGRVNTKRLGAVGFGLHLNASCEFLQTWQEGE